MTSGAAAKQMSRLFGSCGSEASQDVLVAADVDLSSEDEREHAAWAAYREAKKKGNLATTEERGSKKGESTGKSDGQLLNGFNRRSRDRNR